MTSVSEKLHSASGGGRFAEVTVILPKMWAGTECQNGRNVTTSSLPENFEQADFVVSGSNPIFGAKPLARQFGSCGVTGLGVDLPFEILTESQNVSAEIGEFLI